MTSMLDSFFLKNIPLLNNGFIKLFSLLADPKCHLLLWGSLTLYFLWKKKSGVLQSKVLYFFALTNFIMLICGILKICVGRARPFLLEENISGFFYFSVNHAYLSFPSSHSAIALAMSHTLRHYYKVSYVVYLFPILIGLSRVSLHKHFASDVIAGLGIGLILSLTFQKIYSYTLRNLRTTHAE